MSRIRTFGARNPNKKIYGDKKGINILKWILQINGMQAWRPLLILYQRHREGKGVFLKFEALDNDLKDAILAKNLVLRAGICKLRLTYKLAEEDPESAVQQPMEEQKPESDSTPANSESAGSAEKCSTN